MGRIRTIKPAFYKHEDLYEAEKTSGLPLRVAFSGLWTVCDREGRFAWKPRALKTDVLPYDDCDFSQVLEALVKFGFIVKYALEGRQYGHVPSWHEHQVINPRESKSVIPFRDASPRVDVDANPARGEGNGREKEMEEESAAPPAEARAQRTAVSPSPESIASRVQERTGIVTGQSLKFLTAVCRRELNSGIPPDAVVDAMADAWVDYQKSIPSLSITPGAEKFFGEGLWKDRASWPWKNGQAPIIRKPMKAEPQENHREKVLIDWRQRPVEELADAPQWVRDALKGAT